MPKIAYTQDAIDQLYYSLAVQGRIDLACSEAGIHRRTYYLWLETHSDFKERMEEAQRRFRHNCSNEAVLAAREAVMQNVRGEQKIVSVKRSIKTIEMLDRRGNRLGTQVITSEETTEQAVPAAKWAIDKVLPQSIHSLEDLQRIALDYGCELVIRDREIFDRYANSERNASN